MAAGVTFFGKRIDYSVAAIRKRYIMTVWITVGIRLAVLISKVAFFVQSRFDDSVSAVSILQLAERRAIRIGLAV